MRTHNVTRLTRSTVRVITVIILGVAVSIATADGFAQSYSGLYRWALEHQLSGWKAQSFPLLVDLFVLCGELGLFLLALDGHKLTKRPSLSWVDLFIPTAVASAGWGVSLWFNVGHVQNASFDDKVTAGVPPVTAMIGLIILLRNVHRYMAKLDEGSSSAVTYDMSRDPTTLKILSQLQADEIDDAPDALPTAGEVEPSGQADSPVEATPAGNYAVRDIAEGENAMLVMGTAKTGYAGRHAKWDEGVRIYSESRNGPGKPLSQRDLASKLGMSNRSLAAAIIRHVEGMTNANNE